jgi:hypothetical protein
MTRLEQALRILEDEFDAFVIMGSMYNPDKGITEASHYARGNGYAIEGMVDEMYSRYLVRQASEASNNG